MKERRKTAMEIAMEEAVSELPSPEQLLIEREEQEDLALHVLLLSNPRIFTGKVRRLPLVGPKRPKPGIRDEGFGKQVEEADEIFDQTLRNYN